MTESNFLLGMPDRFIPTTIAVERNVATSV